MKRMILTIDEARQQQRWHELNKPDTDAIQTAVGPFDYRLSVSTPELPHAFYDDARLMIAYRMTEQLCSEQHIKEQINWKQGGLNVKTLLKRYWASREAQ